MWVSGVQSFRATIPQGIRCRADGVSRCTTAANDHPRATMPMKIIKSYSTRVEADLARIALEAADVPSVVVGLGVNMDGGTAGVQLLVPDEKVEAALTVL